MNFAGNIAPSEAWEILSSDKLSCLIDVRTRTELKFVGATDLSDIGKETTHIPLVDEMGNQNPSFMQEIDSIGHDKNAPMIFICHGGGRSLQAAMAAAQLGYKTYNFENGFCGDANEKGQRSCVNGWVAADLPWRQA